MKIVFVLLLAVAWVSTASGDDCKDVWPASSCKAVNKQTEGKFCSSPLYRGQVLKTCKKTCGLCGPWNACDAKTAGKDNVMCIYKKGVFGPRCTKHGDKSTVKTEPLSKKLQNDIVKRINDLRKKVADGKQKGMPEGTIPPVKWDDGLAAAAQRWADQCPDGAHPHSKNNAIKQFPTGAGQNFASSSTSAKDVPKSISKKQIDSYINGWYGEVKNFVHYHCSVDHFSSNCVYGKPSLQKKYPGGAEIGHFTALIWAKTTKVGCGYIKSKTVSGGHHWYTTVFICDFGPEGNMSMMGVGEPIYKKK